MTLILTFGFAWLALSFPLAMWVGQSIKFGMGELGQTFPAAGRADRPGPVQQFLGRRLAGNAILDEK